MDLLRRLTGTGSLRPPGMKAAEAEYWLTIQRRTTGPDAGELVITGQVQTDMAALFGAGGRAWLSLEDGATYEVRLHRLTTTVAEISIQPPFDGLAD